MAGVAPDAGRPGSGVRTPEAGAMIHAARNVRPGCQGVDHRTGGEGVDGLVGEVDRSRPASWPTS